MKVVRKGGGWVVCGKEVGEVKKELNKEVLLRGWGSVGGSGIGSV